jgi:hypothetical protein
MGRKRTSDDLKISVTLSRQGGKDSIVQGEKITKVIIHSLELEGLAIQPAGSRRKESGNKIHKNGGWEAVQVVVD